MKISSFNFWKFTSLILFILTILVIANFYKEYQKNLPYKKELIYFKENVDQAKIENSRLLNEILSLKHPLNLEKEKKDKFGEALEGEKVILVADELLESLSLPFLNK